MIFYCIIAIAAFGLMGGEIQLVGEGGGVVIFAVFLAFLLAFFMFHLKRPERREPEIHKEKIEPATTKGSGSNELFYAIAGGLIIEILTGRL